MSNSTDYFINANQGIDVDSLVDQIQIQHACIRSRSARFPLFLKITRTFSWPSQNLRRTKIDAY